MRKANPHKIVEFKKLFGEKIAELRKHNKWTQEELAYRCNISLCTVRRAEKNISPYK